MDFDGEKWSKSITFLKIVLLRGCWYLAVNIAAAKRYLPSELQLDLAHMIPKTRFVAEPHEIVFFSVRCENHVVHISSTRCESTTIAPLIVSKTTVQPSGLANENTPPRSGNALQHKRSSARLAARQILTTATIAVAAENIARFYRHHQQRLHPRGGMVGTHVHVHNTVCPRFHHYISIIPTVSAEPKLFHC
jgi:hypothetical protein